MRLTAALCLMLISVTPPLQAQEPVATLSGVAAIKDGDGVLFGNVEVRLQGVAAPELDDVMGRESYLGLIALAEGKRVVCELDGTTAGATLRPVGVCFVNDQDIGRAQIEAGLARDCPAFSKGRYRDAEIGAQSSGNNLSKLYDLPSYC